MDCPSRRRKNSVPSEEEARKMSRVSWIQDPQGMSHQQQQQQLLDHHMILRLQQQQQQTRESDQISNSALSLQQRAMAAIALQEIRSSIDPSKLVQQHHRYQQLINPGTPPPSPAAIAATMAMNNKATVSNNSNTSSANTPGTPSPSPAQPHTLQSFQSIHQSIQQQQNPSFTTNPLPILDSRPLYIPIAPLVSSSSISSTPIEAFDHTPVPVPLISSSSKMMMPSSQLMMANIPPVIFPPSLVTSSSSSATAAASSPIVVPSTPPPPKPVVTKSCLSPMRNMVPDVKDLQQQQALKSSPCSTSKWFSASSVPPSLQELRGQTLVPHQVGAGGWLGGDCANVSPVSLDHHQQQQQHLHHHHHHQQDLVAPNENIILPQDHPIASTGGCFNVTSVPIGSPGMSMPPPGNFRSSSQQGNMTNSNSTVMNPRGNTSPVDQVIADLKNIVSSSMPDSYLGVENSSKQLKSVQVHQQQQHQHQHHHPRQRTFTKVYKLGSIGRAVDVARFKNYVELRAELSRMFGLDGQLDQRNGWQLVFVDKENDLLLVGDDPWEEFVSSVRGIRILSPSEVSYYTSEERSVEAA